MRMRLRQNPHGVRTKQTRRESLPMNTGHFTAPLQGARLILGLYPGLRLACPGLLSFGPSGAFFYRAECSFQA